MVLDPQNREDGVVMVWREMMGGDEMGMGRGEVEEGLVREVLWWFVLGLRPGDIPQMKEAYARLGGDLAPVAREFLKLWSHVRRTGTGTETGVHLDSRF